MFFNLTNWKISKQLHHNYNTMSKITKLSSNGDINELNISILNNELYTLNHLEKINLKTIILNYMNGILILKSHINWSKTKRRRNIHQLPIDLDYRYDLIYVYI